MTRAEKAEHPEGASQWSKLVHAERYVLVASPLPRLLGAKMDKWQDYPPSANRQFREHFYFTIGRQTLVYSSYML